MPVAGELVEATREGADYLVHRFTLIKSKKFCTVMDASLFCSNENIRKWKSVYNTAAIRLLLRRCGAVHAGAMIFNFYVYFNNFLNLAERSFLQIEKYFFAE